MYIYYTILYYLVRIITVPAKSSPHDEIPMNPNPTYKVMNPDSKEPTGSNDYEDVVVQPSTVDMTPNPSYAAP